jgi:peptidoglycan/LPS O-acetylase OafA/YrhL
MIMTNSDDVFTITVRRRPWWFWALAALWLLLEIVLVQTALASARESEIRAATLSWIAAAVLAAIGVFGWLHRGDSRKPNELNESV